MAPLVRCFVSVARLIRVNKILSRLTAKSRFCQWLWQWTNYNSGYEMRTSTAQKTGLNDLIDWLGGVSGLTLVEIGSYRGESASMFLRSGKFAHVYCVDPWDDGYDINDFAGFTNMRRVEKDFDKHVGGDSRVIKVKGTIETLVKNYPALRPDVVYIDGCHTYEAVKNDITVTLDKLKPTLAICGHDYSDNWPGCRAAIVEMCGIPDKTFADTSWAKKTRSTA